MDRNPLPSLPPPTTQHMCASLASSDGHGCHPVAIIAINDGNGPSWMAMVAINDGIDGNPIAFNDGNSSPSMMATVAINDGIDGTSCAPGLPETARIQSAKWRPEQATYHCRHGSMVGGRAGGVGYIAQPCDERRLGLTVCN